MELHLLPASDQRIQAIHLLVSIWIRLPFQINIIINFISFWFFLRKSVIFSLNANFICK